MAILCNVMLHNLVQVPCFGGTYCFDVQCKMSPSRYSQQLPLQLLYLSIKLHGIKSKKTVNFMVTPVRTSNLTNLHIIE